MGMLNLRILSAILRTLGMYVADWNTVFGNADVKGRRKHNCIHPNCQRWHI
jgi:hypothetical protein